MKESVDSILFGMPSLLSGNQQLSFNPLWPFCQKLPNLPQKQIAADKLDQPVNLLKLMPQKKKKIMKCKNCVRRTYENSSLCRKCYLEKHGELKRRCMHQKSKLYARGLCKHCYFTYYNHNLRLKVQDGATQKQLFT